MQQKTIKLKVKKGGSFTIETVGGYVGHTCETDLDQVIASVGGKVEKKGAKDDRYKYRQPTAFVNVD